MAQGRVGQTQLQCFLLSFAEAPAPTTAPIVGITLCPTDSLPLFVVLLLQIYTATFPKIHTFAFLSSSEYDSQL